MDWKNAIFNEGNSGQSMDWKKLFAIHILERGYDYYCENAVENLAIKADIIRADVMGSEDYEVEIKLLFSCFLGEKLVSKQIILDIITVGRVLIAIVTHTKFA